MKTTLKEWEDFGLLEELPEDRKEMVVSCYNIVMDWLTKDDSHEEEIESITLPIFYRIAKIVDLTETQVLEICNEIPIAFNNSDIFEVLKEAYGTIDAEAEFVQKFCEEKINYYKNKQ